MDRHFGYFYTFTGVPPAGSEMLFEVFAKQYEQGSLIITSNLPFEEWTHVFGSERLTGALLDRVTHHAHIIPMNGQSYRVASRTNVAIHE